MKSIHEQYLERLEHLKSLSPEAIYYIRVYREYVNVRGYDIDDFEVRQKWRKRLNAAWKKILLRDRISLMSA